MCVCVKGQPLYAFPNIQICRNAIGTHSKFEWSRGCSQKDVPLILIFEKPNLQSLHLQTEGCCCKCIATNTFLSIYLTEISSIILKAKLVLKLSTRWSLLKPTLRSSYPKNFEPHQCAPQMGNNISIYSLRFLKYLSLCWGHTDIVFVYCWYLRPESFII